jgi:hypothetical protein
MRNDPSNSSRALGFTIALPPAEAISRLKDGSYEAPCLFDNQDWASFTPCHLSPVCLPVTSFAELGQISVRCPACNHPWDVLWDPWKAHGRRHALWVG